MSTIQTKKVGANNEPRAIDIEKNALTSSLVNIDTSFGEATSLDGKPVWWNKLIALGVEERGILPVPAMERTDDRFANVFSIWFTMSINCLPYALYFNLMF